MCGLLSGHPFSSSLQSSPHVVHVTITQGTDRIIKQLMSWANVLNESTGLQTHTAFHAWHTVRRTQVVYLRENRHTSQCWNICYSSWRTRAAQVFLQRCHDTSVAVLWQKRGGVRLASVPGL